MTQGTELTTGMRHVQAKDIEDELDTLWREANASALASGGHAGSRNSVLSLAVYSIAADDARRARDAIEGLTSTHPSRAILMTARTDSDGDPIAVYVSTHVAATGTVESYAELIVLEARPDAMQYLPGIVLPLIVSGLPSYLWWVGEPTWTSEQFESLVDGCDRLVVDTSEMAQAEHALVALADVMHRKQSSCAISDFNWTRQGPWRELVAQFFDGAELRPFLAGIDQVTIEYAAGGEDAPANAAAAYLFAGWLASRLGWRTQGTPVVAATGGPREHTFTDAAGRVVVLELGARFGVALRSWNDVVREQAQGAELAHQDGRVPTASQTPCTGPGALMSVHLHATAAGQTATFTVAREADMQHASTLCQVPQSAMPSQTVHLPSLGEGALLAEQLALLGHDTVYEDALALATLLIGPATRKVLP